MCALIPKYPDLNIDTICEHYHTMPATVQERAGMIDSIRTTAKLFVKVQHIKHREQWVSSVIKELVMTVNLRLAFIALLGDIVYINVCAHV